MHSLPRRAAALTMLATLTLSACGGSDSGSDGDSPKKSDKSSAAPGFDAEPADGKTLKGTDYTYSVPDGWDVPKEKPAGFDFDSLAVDTKDKDGFTDNINVLRQDPAPAGLTDKQLGDELGKQLTAQGAKDVEVQSAVTIDGDPASHISSSQDLNGNKNLTEQYYTLHDGALYVVTFSHSMDASREDRDEVAGSILASWKWAS